MKPTLTVLVGAGGSIPLGAPSTAEATSKVFAAVRDKCTSTATTPPGPDLPAIFKRALVEHYGGDLNFEHVLHALEMMDGLSWDWSRPSPRARRIVEGMFSKEPPPALAPLFHDRAFLLFAQRALFESLHEMFAGASERVSTNAEWSAYRDFWQRLDEAFDLTVVTLNYETFGDQAIGISRTEQGFGLPNKSGGCRFHPRLLHSASRRLLHLHGSVHFGYPTPDEFDRFFFEDDWDDLVFFEEPGVASRSRTIRSTSPSQAGRRTTKGPFITGMNKPDKLLVEPYHTYYQLFSHQMQVCPRLLVIGYGFGDLHVNATIDRVTRHHGSERRIASVTINDPSTLQYEFREEFGVMQRWAQERELFNDDPTGVWTSKNALVRVDYRGLLTAVGSTGEMIELLIGAGPAP